jgi:predicted HicB family RNase H-like nuclease
MKNMLSYKGLSAHIEFDPDDNIFFGRVLGVQDIIGFHGETVKELTTDFHNAVNHYLDVCRQRGEKPDKTYSGKLTLRIPPQMHADIAAAAAHTGKSINKWVAETLEHVIQAH